MKISASTSMWRVHTQTCTEIRLASKCAQATHCNVAGCRCGQRNQAPQQRYTQDLGVRPLTKPPQLKAYGRGWAGSRVTQQPQRAEGRLRQLLRAKRGSIQKETSVTSITDLPLPLPSHKHTPPPPQQHKRQSQEATRFDNTLTTNPTAVQADNKREISLSKGGGGEKKAATLENAGMQACAHSPNNPGMPSKGDNTAKRIARSCEHQSHGGARGNPEEAFLHSRRFQIRVQAGGTSTTNT